MFAYGGATPGTLFAHDAYVRGGGPALTRRGAARCSAPPPRRWRSSPGSPAYALTVTAASHLCRSDMAWACGLVAHAAVPRIATRISASREGTCRQPRVPQTRLNSSSTHRGNYGASWGAVSWPFTSGDSRLQVAGNYLFVFPGEMRGDGLLSPLCLHNPLLCWFACTERCEETRAECVHPSMRAEAAREAAVPPGRIAKQHHPAAAAAGVSEESSM